MDGFLYEAGIYIFMLGLIVQSLYRIFDPLLDRIIGKSKKKDEEKEEQVLKQEFDFIIGPQPPKPPKPIKPTWRDLIVPPIIGLFVAWLFWPLTVFDYMPFQPQFPITAYVMTALLISRIANAEHDTFKTIGEFFMGMIHRVYPPMSRK